MPTKRNNGVYYVKRMFRPIGRIHKSLGTRRLGRAQSLERMLINLHNQGRIELLRAFADDRIGIEMLAENHESGRLPELATELRYTDVPLSEATHAALRAKAADVADSTLERYATGLKYFQSFVGDASVRVALSTDRVQEFKATRLADGAARETVNNDLQAVSIVVTYALDKGWIEARPKVKRFKTKVRISYIEAEQINLYMAAVRRPFRPIFQLLIGTGMRLGEAEGLRVFNLKFGADGTRAMIEDSKTPEGVRPVFVPTWVSETLRAHIEKHHLSGADCLFTIPRRTVQKEHKRACEIVGIPSYTIHDHRHTAAVHLARAGMPLNLLQQQLGHARIDMTMRYARFHPDYSDVGTYFDRVEASLGGGANGLQVGLHPTERRRRERFGEQRNSL